MHSITTRFFGGALLALALTVSAAFAAPEIGKPAPAFTLKSAEGKDVSLADYKGKTVVLEWTNKDCPFVVKHYKNGDMQKLQAAAATDGAVWLKVISSAPGAQGYLTPAQALENEKAVSGSATAVLIDDTGSVGKSYDAKHTPELYVIDKEGNLVYKGAIDSIKSANSADIAKAVNYVKSALAAVKEGKAIEKPVTEAYGCSVKYSKN
ncbi:MAG: redoxin domain-containing protein [Candidatus Methylacidiphilales bacterium]|nr:redoxin domain-containing protein [Candidatus Methylacidiphilales bacterium]